MDRRQNMGPVSGQQPPSGPMPDPSRLFDLALSHHQAGRMAEAEPLYRQVLAIAPRHADSLHLLGVLYFQTGRAEVADVLIGQAIAIDSQRSDFFSNHGLVLQTLGQLDAAIAQYGKALAIKPDNADALFNLGISLQLKEDYDGAIARYREAIHVKPDYCQAYNNIGTILQNQGKIDQAISSYQQVLRINPNNPEALNNLGFLFQSQGRLNEAIACYRKTLLVKPDYLEVINNLGNCLTALGRFGDALAVYAQAQRVDPRYPDAHWNESMVRLLLGDFAGGWPGYEWRWQVKGTAPHGLAQPLWDGAPLNGKTILLHCEQGYGDCIQFIRYATQVKRQAAQVVVFAPPELARLFQTASGVDQVVTRWSEIPDCHCRAPLVTLPLIFKTTLATIPAGIPYLAAEPGAVATWRERFNDRFKDVKRPKIGIVWRGRPTHANDRNRSIAPAIFSGLLTQGAGCFVSLDKDRGDGGTARLFGDAPYLDAGGLLNDFADTAAAIAALDLVISVDTAVAHLAGALGKPAWVLLPAVPDWRWLLNRDDSPWYPSVRLFRQERIGDWDGVIAKVIAALSTCRRDLGATPDR